MKGWRTVIFNALMGIIAMLGALGVIEGTDVPDAGAVNAFLDHIEAVVAFVTPLGNVLLRLITTGPVGTKV
jgi:hypothetical protein